MSFFYNPQESGRGVPKEQAKLKPFFRFWEIFGRKFLNLITLNLIYIVICIPIITIGPATAAMTFIMRKFILEQPVFVVEEFFSAFKKNFRPKIIILGIISLITVCSIVFSLIFYGSYVTIDPNLQNYFMFGMSIVASSIFLTIIMYIYPQIIFLELDIGAIIRNSVKFCLLGFKQNVVVILSVGALFFAIFSTLPYSLIALPVLPFGQLAFLAVFNTYPVIQKYIIDPFYEARGETNPEYKTDDSDDENSQRIFTDLGGKETPLKNKKIKTNGKIIK